MEPLAPMRLYTLSKRHFVLVFVVFFVCFGLTVFVGIRGPKVIQTSAANFSLNNSKELKPVQILSNPLSTYNQQLWLTCVVELEHSKETAIQTNFTMTVKVDGVAQDGTTMFIHNKVHNRTRTLTCAGKCAEIIVAHLSYLNYTQYTVTVGFKHLKERIKEMNFTWKTYDPAFSHLEIWFRFVFVVLTFIVTCLFAHSLRKFSMRDWGIEQKWMSILLPLLLLYNDPFFPLSFLVNSWFPGMLDDLFQSVFLCALLLFWLCVYHGIRVQGERKCLTFYLPKCFIVGLLWLACVTLGIWQTINELHDPMYQYRVDTGNFQGMKVFFMVVAAMYILYLLFLIVRACSELRHMPYVDLRLKFLTALTFVVLVISIVILYLRFGAQVLQDNFVAELSTHYQNYILPWEDVGRQAHTPVGWVALQACESQEEACPGGLTPVRVNERPRGPSACPHPPRPPLLSVGQGPQRVRSPSKPRVRPGLPTSPSPQMASLTESQMCPAAVDTCVSGEGL
ncbi:transmembrane protein 181 isoform X1 [Lagenorhynchus albirostris]|uniref:transmembrane protein 181 isoform X1 n=1 Tax=Lagenorhynchus albirostris TaxID=27610 RepID=UPI0028EE22EF|nr:transmembrane protein 181 isoform X1 [Lagenorhynchus albirostris]